MKDFRTSSHFLLTLLCLVLLLAPGCGAPETSNEPDGTEGSPPQVRAEIWPAGTSPLELDPDVESQIDEMIAAMTVPQKVGQVIQSEIRHTTPEDVTTYHLGSVLNGGGSHPGGDKHAQPEDWLALADAYWRAAQDDSDGAPAIPILWGVDAVHGHNNVIGSTLFPHNVALGATRNAELVRRIGEATAREVAVTGLDWNFSPTLAVVRDDRWGRTYEGYSEDPALVAELGAAYVEGIQGVVGTGSGAVDDGGDDSDFLGEGHLLATAKHYLGDGGTDQGIDQGDNLASEEDLRDIHGPGYVSTLEAGVQTVMASFSGWHGKKMHGNRGLLTDVLKDRMGFDGFVVGDWNGHGQVAGCTNDDCAAALNAGVDMFMVPEDWKGLIENTIAQVESGEIPMARLDDAVRRILRVKHRFGLFDPARRGVKPSERPLAGQTELIGADEHREVARQAVRESLVLLKNDGALPIDPSQTVLVAGDGADDLGKQAGGWTITWQGTGNQNADFPGATSIWQGVKDAVEAGGGTAELSADGSYRQKPDVAVVVFGEDPYAEMQGDRLTMQYAPGDSTDIDLLRSLQADGIPTVSVFLTGRPMWVNPHLNASDAFVVAWLPGTEGAGIADVIVGDPDGSARHEFTGKLPYSWPKSVLQAVINFNPAAHEQDGGEPLFAYGFGLGYGDDGSLAELSEAVEAEVGLLASQNYFRGGPVPPWQLVTDGNVEIAPVDREVQEDARSATWPGDGAASVALRSEETFDLRREANAELVMAFDVMVETEPTAPVTLSVVSSPGQYAAGGAGDIDITNSLPAADGEWHTVRLYLSCFAAQGANLQEIHTAWKLSTEGDLALRFAEVGLVSKSEGEATCPGVDQPEGN